MRLYLACDGARSTVRKAIGRELHGDSANHAWGVMDVLAVTDFPDIRFKSLIQSAKDGSLLGVIAGHVDDLVYGGNKWFHKHIIKKILDKYVIGKVDTSKFTFVGWELKQTEDAILLSQKNYLEEINMEDFDQLKLAKGSKQEIVNDELQHQFRSANGLLGWIVQVSRPDLNYVFVEKSTRLGNATVEDCRSIYRILGKARQEFREIKFSNLGPFPKQNHVLE